MANGLTREVALQQAMDHVTAAMVALEQMEPPEYVQDANEVEARIRSLKVARSMLAGFASRTYPVPGYMVEQFSDGKRPGRNVWIAFHTGRLARSAGGGPCWSSFGAPDCDSREEAEEICRWNAAQQRRRSAGIMGNGTS